MQYSDWSHSDSLFCPLLALQPQQQRAILSSFMIVASLMMCSQLAAFFRLMLCGVNSDPQYTHTVSRSRTSTSSSAGIFQLFAMIILPNSLISLIKKLVNLIVHVKFFSQKSPGNPCGVLISSLVLEYKILRDM